jgi:hypothetical protein
VNSNCQFQFWNWLTTALIDGFGTAGLATGSHPPSQVYAPRSSKYCPTKQTAVVRLFKIGTAGSNSLCSGSPVVRNRRRREPPIGEVAEIDNSSSWRDHQLVHHLNCLRRGGPKKYGGV